MYVITTDKSKQFFFIKGFIGITLDRCTNKFGSMGSTINFLLKTIMIVCTKMSKIIVYAPNKSSCHLLTNIK